MANSPIDLHSQYLDKVFKLARNYYSGNDFKNFKKFVAAYYENIAADELRDRSTEKLFGLAHNHWQLSQSRKKNEIKLQVFNAETDTHVWKSKRSIMQVVLNDSPFIIDSIGLIIERLGYNINLTIHPRLSVKREKGELVRFADRTHSIDKKNDQYESLVCVEFGPETNKAALKNLKTKLLQSLKDLKFAIQDWQNMRETMQNVAENIEALNSPLKTQYLHETQEFLQWLLDDHFIFLGYREYSLTKPKGKLTLSSEVDTGLGILRKANSPKSVSTLVSSEEAQKQINQRGLLILTKANALSTIHRDSHLDYIGVKVYNKKGNVIGEKRFLGLYTSVAYSRSPRYIPLLRQKVARVLEASNLRENSHAGKALLHTLENYPRDELIQSNLRELGDAALGLVQLQERKRVKLFVRRDAFSRFFTFQVYVPRDYYNTEVRESIESILKDAVGGVQLESQVQISSSALARVYIVIWTPSNERINFQRKAIEKKIREATRPWSDSIHAHLIERMDLSKADELIKRYGKAFPNAYIEDVSAYEASHDIERLDTLGTTANDIKLSLYRPIDFPSSSLRFKIFRYEQSIPISDALPMLENLGFRAISERPYQLHLDDDSIIWIQDIELVHAKGEAVAFRPMRDSFHAAFAAIWRGQAENDKLNTLVTDARLEWREVAVLRAYLRYLRQTNLPYSRLYMTHVLLEHPEFARQIFRLFAMLFDPNISADKRKKLVSDAESEVRRELRLVTSLDKDRILRAFYNTLKATLRTNYYQTDEQGDHKTYISFKFNPEFINELPLPLPKFEIWVYSPKVEGVHLRGGEVARGGLRWSDRPEDFRTEVLGLMKAQMVKNSVIVPVGAKGCFIVRNPITGDRDRAFEQGRECYKDFIRGLIDITDNLDGEKIIPPAKVVRKDKDDPYLVVAADKGTATFSDTANAVADEYGFWMGDAFASGGSVGYDHKKMGITARGAWESVKRHFLELAKDIQKEEFTVAGIGDMGGDVFGNGMLLSPHIRLLAAFNHMHIFLDPNPDTEKSYKERERLFNLPRSSWQDYSSELISKGGGIFSRTSKEISLSPEVKAMLGLNIDKATPTAVIKAILRSNVELLWNGGIGTYAKASTESHNDVGDRANDNVRVNANELICRVIGEGGNLGFTHKSRIEFSLNGGFISTDFIDNAGGVDCSDHEVNIKILLNLVASKSKLTTRERTKLLASMTNDVADLVLDNNYMQALSLSILESRGLPRTREYMRVIRNLESKGLLNRKIEFLPTENEVEERLKTGNGLSRPEIATILSYSKIDLFNSLLVSDVLEDNYLQKDLINYFPTALQKKYSKYIPQHRLSREIIANQVGNAVINRMGPAFMQRLGDETGTSTTVLIKSYLSARDVFELPTVWEGIKSLDGLVPANKQYAMYVDSSNLLKHATRWMLSEVTEKTNIQSVIDKYQSGLKKLYTQIPKVLSKEQKMAYSELREKYIELGLKDRVAKRIASTRFMQSALDIVDVSLKQKTEVSEVALTYFKISESLDINWLQESIINLKANGRWQAMARNSLRDQTYLLHKEITNRVLSQKKTTKLSQLEKWVGTHQERINYLASMLKNMQDSNATDFSSITVVIQEMNKLLEGK